MTIYKGDNLQAFNMKPIRIDFNSDINISKAAFVINNGIIVKEFINPVSPIFVELDENDTAKLSQTNKANFIVWDNQGRKKTCDVEVIFKVKEEIYHDC